MVDPQFSEQYHALWIPAHFDARAPFHEQTLYALAQPGEATADEVVRKLEALRGGDPDKLLIARIHQILTGWHDAGLIADNSVEGGLRCSEGFAAHLAGHLQFAFR